MLLVDEHKGYFQFEAVMNKTGMIILVEVFFENMFLFLLGKYPGMELLGYKVSVY